MLGGFPEVDEQGRLLLRWVGVATYTVLGNVTLGDQRIPTLAGFRPVTYGRAVCPPQICNGCKNPTDDIGKWRYKGQVLCSSQCYERVKKQPQRTATPRKDGRPHRWEKPEER